MQNQTIRERLEKLPLFVLFLFCCLEWGGVNSGFILHQEYGLLSGKSSIDSITPPVVLFPLMGQLLLLAIILVPLTHRKLTITSLLSPGVLVLMILLVGLLSLNLKIIACSLPLVARTVYYRFRFNTHTRTLLEIPHHESAG